MVRQSSTTAVVAIAVYVIAAVICVGVADAAMCHGTLLMYVVLVND
jgi:uncharacterized membrane protein